MNKTKLLCSMYENLSESLRENVSSKKLYENYKKQLDFYEALFKNEQDFGGDESSLVCARCFISLSRSLFENRHRKKEILTAKRELDFLKPVFSREISRESVTKTVQDRINALSKNKSDEIGDSILFLYLALTEL